MLTAEQIISSFQSKINETPDDVLIEIYKEYTQEQLDAVLDRNVAIKNDPTFSQRLAENYKAYLAATPEEQANWVHIDPQ
jgi:hypothetical protein